MAKKPLEIEQAFSEQNTTVVYESRETGGADENLNQNNSNRTNEVEGPPSNHPVGGGGGAPHKDKANPPVQPVTPIETKPAIDPEEVAQQERLKKGDATPDEALAYFQTHGYPEFKNLPTFVNGVWLFPEGAPGSQPQWFSADGIGAKIVAAPSQPVYESQPPTGTDSRPPKTPAPASGASPPPPPVPGSVEAARQTGMSIGQVYGEFRAWSESFANLLQDPHGGVSVWDRMSAAERTAAIQQVQVKYDSLPKLPASVNREHDNALKEGFQTGAAISYDAARWENRAVWVAAELAKSWVLAQAAMPTPITIGSVGTDKFSDCAAQTASLVLENSGHPGVPASYLRSNFGLPRTSISSYRDAVSYAKNWFTELGFELNPQSGGFGPISQGGVAGNYVIFFQGGASGGHVVYGSVTANGVRLVDGQLNGATWTSVMDAQTALGMRFVSSHRVLSVTPP